MAADVNTVTSLWSYLESNKSYTRCYCEENVWKLCQKIRECHIAELSYSYVVFISNTGRQVPLWMQQAAKTVNDPVIWDYHVILVHKSPSGGGSTVYDLDTRLPVPCDFLQYAKETVRSDLMLKPQFYRSFRVIRGEEFLNTFASDRSHMLKEDGTWLADPPGYECIQSSVSTNNIQDFISMGAGTGFGQVLSSEEFLARFSSTEDAFALLYGPVERAARGNNGNHSSDTRDAHNS